MCLTSTHYNVKLHAQKSSHQTIHIPCTRKNQYSEVVCFTFRI